MSALIGNNAVPRKSIPFERFDGIRAIQAHINKRNQVEAYVHGYYMDASRLPRAILSVLGKTRLQFYIRPVVQE